jgi:pilus assembly protein CpaB
MNRRLLTVLGFAFLVALGATLLLYGLIANRIRGSSSAEVGAPIVVAARDLQRGTLVKDGDIKTVAWGSTVRPKGSFAEVKDVLNRGVVLETVEGEPMTELRLAPRSSGAGLAPSIPIGKRAVALRVNDVVAVSGYVIPGSRVDVLITGNAPGEGQQGPVIRTILQNVEVLSAGEQIQRDAEGKPLQVAVITVLVTPEEAETLSLASNETRIQLVLRNPMDDKKVEPPGTAVARLFHGGGPPPAPKAVAKAPKPVVKTQAPPPPPPPPPPILVELLKGTNRKTEKFEAEEKGTVQP